MQEKLLLNYIPSLGSSPQEQVAELIHRLENENGALLRFKERIETILESSSIDGNKISLIIEEATALRRFLRTLQ